jgi:hypothetical protein
MLNTISNGTLTVTVNNKNRPYRNNFTQVEFLKMLRTRNGRDAMLVLVKCTADSTEPGRLYSVVYTLNGTMMSCNTEN